MTTFAFRVTDVFDLASRPGLLVVGTVLRGEARPGTILRDQASGERVRLLGIDLACGRTPGSGGFALIVDRSDRDHAQAGRVWVSADSADSELG